MATIPPQAVRLLPQVARYVSRLFATRSRTSAPLSLGRFTANYSYRAPRYSGAQSLYRYRWLWSRRRIPLYGTPRVTFPAVSVLVPSSLQFRWENPEDLPEHLPQGTFRPNRNFSIYDQIGAPYPDYEFQIAQPPPRYGGRTRGLPPEEHRRRHDSKLDWGYNRMLRLINATYGEYDEYMEFLHAFQNNDDPRSIATALALNEAVDRKYGYRARFLKANVYDQPFYRLPVGFDTLSRVWR